MAIQHRRGKYDDFDPTKMIPGEIAVVQSDDPSATDGKTVYMAFAAGNVKRLATAEEVDVVESIASNAEGTAIDSLNKANDAENHMATLDAKMKELEIAMKDVSIDPDDLGLYQDEDTHYVYPTYRGVVSENGIPLAGGGGGGGGGEVIDAVLTVENTTGWLSRTIADGSECHVTFNWSSIEDDMPTGDGSIRITVNDVVKTTYQIAQGNVDVDLSPYLSTGTNKVKVRISDTYDQGKTTTFNITAVVLSISSTFDASTVYNGVINFAYTPVGAVEKTVYFVVDGNVIGTQETSVSNRQLSYAIPPQTHGSHSLKVYFEATINTETVRSNELYYEFLFVEPSNNTPIIASSFNAKKLPQYTTVALPFLVYTPNSLTSEVTISVNGTVVSTQTVDRTEQSYSYKANEYGNLTFTIATGKVHKDITLEITESEIDVEAETKDLALYLSAQGRGNAEATRDVWEFQPETGDKISCSLTGFNFTSDGWQNDADNNTALRVSGNARVTIPYKPFENDFRTTGKTIELEFATRNVLDYDATILSCMSEGRGLSLTAQKATMKSEQSEISTQYKEEEHIRVTFVTEKRTENRLLFVYINAIPSGVIQYPVDDDFAQTTPVNISIGSNDCTIDLYCIRVYDNDLTRNQVLENWIADTPDGTTMLDRYARNNVYDAYGKIQIASLPSYLPYFILNAEELPQYKGDKKIITGTYTDPMYPSKSFSFTGCQINVQGTSSAPYARKNYDMQFKEGFELSTGHANNYALRTGAIPFNRFVLKADVASSEGANNVELVRLYDAACVYKTPGQREDARVRQGIDGYPIVIFWTNTDTGETVFIGKYNWNNDKSTEEVFGFQEDDESWEVKNNTGDRVLYKSADYSGTDWLNDFEARFPDTDPPYEDPAQLQAFAEWIVQTDTERAAGDALPEPVTYGGREYTSDTAEYRLAKFKAEIGNYVELQSAEFYYLFTELFLMVDSRAKNMFPSFMGTAVVQE